MLSTLKRIGIIGAAYKLSGRLFPKEKEVLGICDRIGAYRYLKKYEKIVSRRPQVRNFNPQTNHKKIIWICWLQGFDKAPLLVKKCKESVLKYHSDCEVIALDESNLSRYIDIPDYITEKHNKGIIHHTQFSDYVRIALLAKYGGVWIDSTTLLTNNLPEYILNADLFCYKINPIGKVLIGSWFIAAKQNHPIVLHVLSLFDEYWKKENKLISYSLIHLCWTLAVNANETNRKLWNAVPYFDNSNCFLLQMDLFSPYSETRFKQITQMSSVHKLTYKFDEKDAQKEDTFYQHIIQDI